MLLRHFIYERVIKISYIRFERGKNSLSSGKESFLSVPLYRREIGLDICPITFASYVILSILLQKEYHALLSQKGKSKKSLSTHFYFLFNIYDRIKLIFLSQLNKKKGN